LRDETACDSGDHAQEGFIGNPIIDRDLLSGYEEYLRDFYDGGQGLRVTPQGTLSLSLGHCMQVDIALDGAIRVLNPKVTIIIFSEFNFFVF
jgi:hypothetical protein